MGKEIKITTLKLVFILVAVFGFNILSLQAAVDYVISANSISYTDNANLGADNVQAAIDGTCTKFSAKLNNMMEQVYPVGSIYISTSITSAKSVATTLGVGTWEKYAQGRTLIGEGTGTDSNGLVQTFKNSDVGGEYFHKLTTAEMPSHSHGVGILSDSSTKVSGNLDYTIGRSITNRIGWSDTEIMYGRVNAGYTQKVGENGNHNNIQPYITVYMYKRVS